MLALEKLLNERQRTSLRKLTTPLKIQQYLDKLPYSSDDWNRCPLTVVREHKANCFDGALFGAAALTRLGHPASIVYLIAVRDDEHMLAVYKRNGCWGAIAKSNFVGLRFREPIHRSVRELAISYFEPYFNVLGRKSLRAYTLPLRLSRFDHMNWMVNDEALQPISDALDAVRSFPLLSRKMIAGLSMVDRLSYRAQLREANPAGLYYPPGSQTEGRSFKR